MSVRKLSSLEDTVAGQRTQAIWLARRQRRYTRGQREDHNRELHRVWVKLGESGVQFNSCGNFGEQAAQ